MSNTDWDGDGIYIAMISVHGLVRGHDLELGRDADTGGQVKYVVELARFLARQPGIAGVDLFTRLIAAPDTDPDCARERAILEDRARIVRIVAGPVEEYLPKEALWDYLDSFIDNMMTLFREADR